MVKSLKRYTKVFDVIGGLLLAVVIVFWSMFASQDTSDDYVDIEQLSQRVYELEQKVK